MHYFPCSADHEQDWQPYPVDPYPVDPYSAICDDHTYIHTYILLGPITYRKDNFYLTPRKSKVVASDTTKRQPTSHQLEAHYCCNTCVASKARKGCQPVRQTSSLPGPPTDGSVGHISRGEQKAQTASQEPPGTASACEGLIEQGSYDRVPRNNDVEAGRGFSRMPRGNDNIYLVLRRTNRIHKMLC